MKSIHNVSMIGLGALGIMYGHHMSKKMPFANLRVIVDEERFDRYSTQGVYCNDEACQFNYVTPDRACEPADLLLVTVKFSQLQQALKDIKNHVGQNTIIISALNGIVSEEIIGEIYGKEHVLYCVAQGMDAVKEQNRMYYKSMGMLCFGEYDEEISSQKVLRVSDFFDRISMPYEINNKMGIKLWSKLMANVGINQAVALYGGTTSVVQHEGEARTAMIQAMKEVLVIARLEKVELTEKDIDYWLDIIDRLNPEGLPSMAQDVKAKRLSEVELFAGTIVTLGEKHQVEVPINTEFYKKIQEIEKGYSR
jgi:2-dehydropantoate 2-reductase